MAISSSCSSESVPTTVYTAVWESGAVNGAALSSSTDLISSFTAFSASLRIRSSSSFTASLRIRSSSATRRRSSARIRSISAWCLRSSSCLRRSSSLRNVSAFWVSYRLMYASASGRLSVAWNFRRASGTASDCMASMAALPALAPAMASDIAFRIDLTETLALLHLSSCRR